MPHAPQMPEAGGNSPDGAAAHRPVVDAPKGNWVDRFAPPATRPYLRLSRADRPIGTWLLLIPCLWGIGLAAFAGGGFKPWDLWLALSCAAGAFLMRGAGCTWNDYTDREFDAAVARTKSRPLPSGQVTPRQALVWMVVQALIAAAILWSYNWPAVILGISSLGLVAIYPFAKRFTWWPQVFLGLAFNWGVLLAFAAHQAAVSFAALVLYASGVVWTLFYDTIYAHQDKEDDALIGVKSTARLFGARTKGWLRLFLVASVLLMSFAIMLAVPTEASGWKLGLALAGCWGFAAHLSWQLARLDTEDPIVCMHLFRSNRDAGLIPALFLAVAALL